MTAPTHDTPNAVFLRKLFPGKSYCFKCGRPWGAPGVKGHETQYSQTSACFPLCEECWFNLEVPEARIEYYKMLIDNWAEIGWPVSEETQQDILKAVANGG